MTITEYMDEIPKSVAEVSLARNFTETTRLPNPGEKTETVTITIWGCEDNDSYTYKLTIHNIDGEYYREHVPQVLGIAPDDTLKALEAENALLLDMVRVTIKHGGVKQMLHVLITDPKLAQIRAKLEAKT